MYKFKFADIGEGINEGQILKWMFKEGEQVKEGETLCIVETDKVNAEIPSPVDGTIKEIKAPTGTTIEVGEYLVFIDDGAEEASDNEEEEDSAGVVGEIEVSEDVIESPQHQEQKSVSKEKVLATPVARKMAKDLGVDITTVKGSGPQGRVMKEDIQKAAEGVNKTQENTMNKRIVMPEAPKLDFRGDIERVKITKLRKTIAENMTLSRTIIPHVTSMDEIDVTNLVKIRNEQKMIASDEGIKLTYLPFIIKALCFTLKEYRKFNASFDFDEEEIIYKNYYNIGIAVDTDEGLIVPVIKNADQLGIIQLAQELKEISEKSRDRSISLDRLQNGTFTITNYGAAGSSYGVPVIRYPEVAILGVGMIKKQPVVIDDRIMIRHILPVSMSYDHRLIDGGDAGRFLMRLKEYLNNPMLLLLS